MKKLSLVAAALLAGLASVSAQAVGSTAGNFNVDITLTSGCRIATLPTVAFTYTAFQPVATAAVTAGSVECTNLLPYTVALDALTTIDDATNLEYTLALGATSGTGNGAAQAIDVTGTMLAGQAGKCGGATCTNAAATNRSRTLTIAY